MTKKLTGFKKKSNRATKNLTGQQKSLPDSIKMVQDDKKGYMSMSFLEKLDRLKLILKKYYS
jgi:hypothetical protein